jgi:triacylglycerol lipase
MSDFVQFPEHIYEQAGNVFIGFAGGAPQYARANARSLMWFAQLAYEVDSTGVHPAAAAKVERIRSKWEFGPVTQFRSHNIEVGSIFDTTGLFGERADAVVLAFAGTDLGVWETIATDADFKADDDDIHAGFHKAANAVTDKVDAAVELSKQRQKPLFITGHSLGGALAILAARYAAKERNHAPRAVYGFGTPRVGGATFRDRYNDSLGDTTYRHVHGRDLVARVPMSFLGYRHVGHVLQVPTGAKFASGSMSANRSNEPDFTLDTLINTLSVLDPFKVALLLGRVAAGQVRIPEDVPRALASLLPPPGHGPLGQTFRLSPLAIREHLQDSYLAAFAP